MLMLDFEIAHRHEDGNRGSRQKQIAEVDSEVVHDHGTHESPLSVLAMAQQVGLRELDSKYTGGGEEHTDKCSCGVGPLPFGRDHQIDEQNAQGEEREQDDGQRQQVIDAGEVLCAAHYGLTTFAVCAVTADSAGAWGADAVAGGG